MPAKAKKRSRRCEGVEVREVRGLNKNVRCPAKATEERELPTATGTPKRFHYCEKCAAYWDNQQRIFKQFA